MPYQPLDLGHQSNPAEFPQAGSARLINVYAQKIGREGRAETQLRAVSGLEAFATLSGTGGVRALLATETDLHAVVGRVVCRVDTSGTVTVLGGLPSDGPVFMARNGRETGSQIGIVCDGLYYMISGGVLSEVSDSDLSPPMCICFLGGYFFYTCTNGRFQWSELDQADAIDGLAIGTARDSPDGLVACAARGRDLILFGTGSYEVWTLNDGSGDAPVSKRSGYKVGMLASRSLVTVNDQVFWLATTDQGAYAGLHTLDGDGSRRIENPAFDRHVTDDAAPSSITGTTWTEDGRTFVAWSGTDWTYVLDLSTGVMHERESAGSRWLVSCAVQFGSNVICGDATGPYLYRLHRDIYDEDGDELVVTIQPPPVNPFPNRAVVNAFHLDLLTGVGLATGATQDVAPTAELAMTDDGEDWTTLPTVSIGRQGQAQTRVTWRRLGVMSQKGRSYRIRCSAAVARQVFAAGQDLTVLPP